jgi:hypothetical protein
MRLFNAIGLFDVYIVTESGEAARAALLAAVADGLAASELVAVETTRESAIRESWRDEKPLVAEDVTERDFQSIKGRGTVEIFKRIYTKDRK